MYTFSHLADHPVLGLAPVLDLYTMKESTFGGLLRLTAQQPREGCDDLLV